MLPVTLIVLVALDMVRVFAKRLVVVTAFEAKILPVTLIVLVALDMVSVFANTFVVVTAFDA
jgi:hypothetical protein